MLKVTEKLASSGHLRNILAGVVLLVLLRLLLPWFEVAIPEHFYEDGAVLLDFFQIDSFKKYLLLVLSILGFVHLFKSKKTSLHLPLLPRVLFIVLIVLQIYTLALMEYNHYFDQWFFGDRIIVAVVGCLTLWFPSLLPIFAIILIVFTQQLGYPDIIGYDHTHKSLVLPILLIIWLFHLIPQALAKRFNHLLTYLILSFMAVWYIQAGWGKLRLNWFVENDLYNLYAAAVNAGWMQQLQQSTRIAIGEFLNEYHRILQVGCVITELVLPFFLVFRRKLAFLIVSTLALFHLMVYLTSGIFFWKWIILEALILCIWALYPLRFSNFWGNRPSIVFVLFICLNLFIQEVTTLAWYDSGYLNTFSFVLEDDRGQMQMLDPTFFAPYDVGISKNRFYFTRNEKPVSGTLGTTMNKNLMSQLRQYREGDTTGFAMKIEKYRNEFGWDTRSVEKEIVYQEFLKKFTRNKLDYDPKFISTISPFIHMQSGENQQNFKTGDFLNLHIIYTEKIVLPHLQYKTFYSDTIVLKLKS